MKKLSPPLEEKMVILFLLTKVMASLALIEPQPLASWHDSLFLSAKRGAR